MDLKSIMLCYKNQVRSTHFSVPISTSLLTTLQPWPLVITFRHVDIPTKPSPKSRQCTYPLPSHLLPAHYNSSLCSSSPAPGNHETAFYHCNLVCIFWNYIKVASFCMCSFFVWVFSVRLIFCWAPLTWGVTVLWNMKHFGPFVLETLFLPPPLGTLVACVLGRSTLPRSSLIFSSFDFVSLFPAFHFGKFLLLCLQVH